MKEGRVLTPWSFHNMYSLGFSGFLIGLIFPLLIPRTSLTIFFLSHSEGRKRLFGSGLFVTGCIIFS